MKAFKNYPGGKDGNGTLQNIINLVPVHSNYFELFLGGGAVFRGMAPSKNAVLNDINPAVYETWKALKYPRPFELYKRYSYFQL